MHIKQGTVSILFGCHSPIHSFLVLLSWIKLYKQFPKPWEIICIFLHDVGHYGKDYLDDYEQKKKHHELGAKICGKLFGEKGFKLVTGHNSYERQERSKLFDPDKYSWIIAPIPWLLFNQIFEPKLIRKNTTRIESCRMFKNAMLENWKKGMPKQGHQIYLEQWNQSQSN
jgi:hypothetical protein